MIIIIIVLGLGGIVSAVRSIVLSKGLKPFKTSGKDRSGFFSLCRYVCDVMLLFVVILLLCHRVRKFTLQT